MKNHGNFSRAVEELIGGKAVPDDAEQVESATPESPVSLERRFDEPKTEAIITADMVIKGTVSSTSNISLSGTVVGDVTSEGDVVLRGRVEGNVTVHSIVVQAGTVVGDITAEGATVVTEGSTVNGNIKAERIEVNGKVAGNLESSAKVVLNPRACIDGNITAAGLSMMDGAELKGSVNVHKSE
jgi:cytoskeletal protein CcmA (bactofilin family)